MPHSWFTIALGRVCMKCSLTQENGKFDDKAGCPRDKPYEPAPEDAPDAPAKKA
jgi:hypothetical protein